MVNVTFDAVYQKVEELYELFQQNLIKKPDKYESEETKDLNESLAKAQSEYPVIACNRVDAYFKSGYADLDEIMLKIRPYLAKYGLSITQRTLLPEDGSNVLQTRLWHASGQWIESRAKIIPSKNDIHTLASTLWYIRRMQIMSLLGITINEDINDDNANEEMISSRKILAKGTSSSLTYNPKGESTETITKEQLAELEYEIGDFLDIAEDLMDRLHIRSLADLPKSRFMNTVIRIREIKELRTK